MSFSPLENWLIVGKDYFNSNVPEFELYSLPAFDTKIEAPINFLITQNTKASALMKDETKENLSSVVWSSNDHFFLVHIENSNILYLYAR